jgi:magnesium-transporting ATPase (P-type)
MAVAKQVGILGADVAVRTVAAAPGESLKRWHSLTATEFDRLSTEEKVHAVEDLCVLARVEPQHKQSLVELLQANSEVRRKALIL